jgi:hypothetical protein
MENVYIAKKLLPDDFNLTRQSNYIINILAIRKPTRLLSAGHAGRAR